MDLKDFVKETLLSITSGVVDAQKETLLYIAPGFVDGEKQTELENIQFEVSVVTSKEAGGGIRLFSAVGGSGSMASENTHKLKFQIPVYFQAPTERNPNHFSNSAPKEK